MDNETNILFLCSSCFRFRNIPHKYLINIRNTNNTNIVWSTETPQCMRRRTFKKYIEILRISFITRYALDYPSDSYLNYQCVQYIQILKYSNGAELHKESNKLVKPLGTLRCMKISGLAVRVRIREIDLGEVGLSATKQIMTNRIRQFKANYKIVANLVITFVFMPRFVFFNSFFFCYSYFFLLSYYFLSSYSILFLSSSFYLFSSYSFSSFLFLYSSYLLNSYSLFNSSSSDDVFVIFVVLLTSSVSFFSGISLFFIVSFTCEPQSLVYNICCSCLLVLSNLTTFTLQKGLSSTCKSPIQQVKLPQSYFSYSSISYMNTFSFLSSSTPSFRENNCT